MDFRFAATGPSFLLRILLMQSGILCDPFPADSRVRCDGTDEVLRPDLQ